MASAVKLEEAHKEPEAVDKQAEQEDEEMEENEDDREEEEKQDSDSTLALGSGKKRESLYLFSAKNRLWFVQNYTITADKNSFLTPDDIASEYSKAHPESRPLSVVFIGKMVRFIWGKKVLFTRRFLPSHTTPDASKKRTKGYGHLMRSADDNSGATILSKSVISLPLSDLAVPGWSVEKFLNPLRIRYRKGVEQLYVNNQAIILEVYFSLHEGDAEKKNQGNSGNVIDVVDEGSGTPSGSNNDNDSLHAGSNNSNINTHVDTINNADPVRTTSATINNAGPVDPVRTTSATILCSGRIISAEKLDIWDNKCVPTLRNVKNLLEVVGSPRPCFGVDLRESWNTECLNEKVKVVVVHKCFDDIFSDNGQKKLISVNCEILPSTADNYCEVCSSLLRITRNRESRKQKGIDKINKNKNNSKMTRAELYEKLKMRHMELQKYKRREKMFQQKLSELTGTDFKKSADSDNGSPGKEDGMSVVPGDIYNSPTLPQ